MGGNLIEQIPWARLGRENGAASLLTDASDGLWLGFFRGGGLAYFKDSQVRASYGVADGMGEGHIRHLRLDHDGALWAATQRGLSRINAGHVSMLSGKNGLPCDTVHWSMEDDDHSVWLYTACGLLRIARSELDAWAADRGAQRSNEKRKSQWLTIVGGSATGFRGFEVVVRNGGDMCARHPA